MPVKWQSRLPACAVVVTMAFGGVATLTPGRALAAPPMPDPTHHLLAYASSGALGAGSYGLGIYVDDVEANTTTEWLAPRPLGNPVISPDATKIAYVQDGNVRVLDLATASSFVAATGSSPQWMPDSTSILFHDTSGPYGLGHQILSVPAVPDSTPVPIPNGTAALAAHVSPDGTKISFIDFSNVTPSGAGSSFLAVMNLDGTNRHSLGVAGGPAAWSPDGTKLAFPEDDPVAPSGSTRLAVINADGTGHTTLSSYPNGLTSDDTDDPVWSTDGSRIFFSELGTSDPYDHDIFAIAPDGTGLTAVKGDTRDVHFPSVSGPSTPFPGTVPGAPTGVTAKAESTSSARIRWSPASDGGSPVAGYTITTFPGGTKTSKQNWATDALVTGLNNGGHYSFTVTATNANGTGPAAYTPTITIDATPPMLTLKPLPVVVTTTASTVGYTATDAGTGVANYDVRYRSATANSAFSSYLSPSGFLKRISTSASVAINPGTTICWSVRARDYSGNVDAWSPDSCTSRVVDDRSLAVKTGGWSRMTSTAYLVGTAMRGGASGAQLASGTWSRGRVRIVVAECSTCGAVRVYAGSTYLGTLSTASSSTRYRVVLSLSSASAGGPIRIVSNSSKPVFIDAIALQRY